MVKQHFLVLLLVEGIEPVVTVIMSTELFESASVEKNNNGKSNLLSEMGSCQGEGCNIK